MTAFYSWRLIFMTFHGHTRADHDTYEHAHESPLVMLVVLAAWRWASVAAGFAFQHYFIGEGYKEFWGKALFEGAAQPHPARHARDPGLGRLGADARHARRASRWPTSTTSPRRRCRRRPRARSGRSTCSCSTSGTSTSCTTGCSCARRSGSAACCGSAATARSSTGWGPTASPTACCGPPGRVVKLQTGYVYHYAFAMLIGVALIVTAFMFAGSWR